MHLNTIQLKVYVVQYVSRILLGRTYKKYFHKIFNERKKVTHSPKKNREKLEKAYLVPT